MGLERTILREKLPEQISFEVEVQDRTLTIFAVNTGGRKYEVFSDDAGLICKMSFDKVLKAQEMSIRDPIAAGANIFHPMLTS